MDTAGPSKKGALLITLLETRRWASFHRGRLPGTIQTKSPTQNTSRRFWRTASHKRKYVNIARISSSCSPSTRKCHKDKVPCRCKQWQNEPFHPILDIVHHTNIATITKQRVFKSPGSQEKRLGMAAKIFDGVHRFGCSASQGIHDISFRGRAE